MPKYIALNKTEHQHAGWQKSDSLAFASQDMVVPVLLEEIPHLLPTIPLAFVSQPRNDGAADFALVGLLSIQPGQNLFLHPQGRWLAGYIPAAYRGYPFRLIPDQQGKQVVCFDMDSQLFRENPMPNEQAFFTSEGELAETSRNLVTFLELCEKNRLTTQSVVNSLAEKKLISEWEINVANPDGEKKPLKGLFKINEQSLRELSGEDLAVLMKSGGVSLAYAQLFSQHRISVFSKLYQLRQEIEKQLAGGSVDVDVEELFGEGSDTLNFDFLNN